MRPDDPNLPKLREIATALGELRDRVVFVGGATAGLLVTDPAAEVVRATNDVDAIIEARIAEFRRVEAELAAHGFEHDVGSDVICRWIHRDSGILFDLMPVDPNVLGFTNRWYRYAIDTAEVIELSEGLAIRAVTAPAFVATKLDAFANRGKGDVLASPDLEDVLNVVDGREELIGELEQAPSTVRDAVRAALTQLLKHADFANALPGLIADASRQEVVMRRLKTLAG
jgi:hypothetical protein